MRPRAHLSTLGERPWLALALAFAMLGFASQADLFADLRDGDPVENGAPELHTALSPDAAPAATLVSQKALQRRELALRQELEPSDLNSPGPTVNATLGQLSAASGVQHSCPFRRQEVAGVSLN